MAKKTKKIKARVNHGRWLWDCPDCGEANRVDLSDGVCANTACFPDVLARARVVKPGHERQLQALARGERVSTQQIPFVDVPDLQARQEAGKRAEKQGRKYEIVLPGTKEKEDGMRLLRKRPTRLMNWHPELGETVEDLRKENKEMGY